MRRTRRPESFHTLIFSAPSQLRSCDVPQRLVDSGLLAPRPSKTLRFTIIAVPLTVPNANIWPSGRCANMPPWPMRAEIVSVGSELLLGQIVDTNAAFIARQLAALGLDLFHKTTVRDNLGRVAATLAAALERVHVVIT